MGLEVKPSLKKYVDDLFATYKPGEVIQVVNFQTGAVATGAITIPLDDTIPQNTEGNEFMTLAITPKNATNKLMFEVIINIAHSAAEAIMKIALFQDDTANALAACWGSRNDGANYGSLLVLRHYMTAGTALETTFKIRAAASAVGTITFNGHSAGRMFGGVMASSITITEIKV